MRRALLLICALAFPVQAQDVDEALEGFDDEPGLDATSEPETEPEATDSRFWSLDGQASLDAAYSYAQPAPGPTEAEYRGWTRLRAELALELDVELPRGWEARVAGHGWRDVSYPLRDRGDFTREVLNHYETELEFDEVWLRGRLLQDLELKAGRQIVVWGHSDNVRVTDVLNPLDNRDPGLADIEDLREPLWMTRLDYHRGRWRLTGIAIHENDFGEQPEFGSDFFPSPSPPPPDQHVANGGSETEWAVALEGRLTGWDVALYWARFHDDLSYIVALPGVAPPGNLERRNALLTMWGASTNVARGNWLWKAEAARFEGLRTFGRPRRRSARSDGLIGVDYAGFNDTTLSFEAVHRHVHGYDSAMGRADFLRNDATTLAFRYNATFLNDRVRVVALALALGARGRDGAIVRAHADYELREALWLRGGIIVFEDGTDLPPVGDWDHNDRLLFSIRYDF